MMRGGSLVMLILLAPMTAFGSITHPDPSAFEPHVRVALEAAREHYREAGGVDSDGATHGALGLVYHAHELLEPAVQCYRIALERAPGDARWPYYLGMIAAETGDLDEARERFEASVKLNPHYGPAKLRLGRVLIALSRRAEAVTVLRAALAEHPDLAALYAELGRLNQQLGHPESAIKQLERALAMQPGANALRFPLAMAYRDLGETERAQALLGQTGQQDVIVDDPLNQRLRSLSRSYSYFLKLGAQAAASGDLAAAERYILAALEISPNHPHVLSAYARVLAASGRTREALEQNARALARDPDYAVALEHRGVLLETGGDETGAIEAYRAALAADPRLADARRLLAHALMRAGEFAAAAREYERLGELRPNDVDAALRIAAARYESGACAPAADTLAAAVEKSQDPGALLAYVRVVATCGAAGPAHRAQALEAMRGLYGVQPSLHAATTLAMIEAANGDFDAAADYQAQAMFVAVRDGRQDLIESLQADLEGYRNERLAARPWRRDHPLSSPPRLTLEQ